MSQGVTETSDLMLFLIIYFVYTVFDQCCCVCLIGE